MPLFILHSHVPTKESPRKALCHTASLLAASLKHKNYHGWHPYPVQLFLKSSCDQLPSYSLNGNNVDPSPRTQFFPTLLISVLGKQIWVLVGRKWTCRKDKSRELFTWVCLPHPIFPRRTPASMAKVLLLLAPIQFSELLPYFAFLLCPTYKFQIPSRKSLQRRTTMTSRRKQMPSPF